MTNPKSRLIKEPFCGLSHGGVVLSVAALVTLLFLGRGRPLHLIGFAVYGTSLIVLYTASTLYHSLTVAPRMAAWLQRCDHSAIYFLIAGSYNSACPITLAIRNCA